MRQRPVYYWRSYLIAAVILAVAAASAPSLSGVVHDSTGAIVPGAIIILRPTSGADRQAVTGPDGRFTIETPESGDILLIIRAGGFAEKTVRLTDTDRTGEVDLVVAPANVLETVTVTPSRGEQRVIDVPASISVLKSEEIKQSPAVMADDVLREVPSFSLFRRSSSLSTHPTSQGVSLRGLGPSGVSRTLVLNDGIPVNDPFGGWVYWSRVPLEGVDRIEVVESSGSSLYGNYAMGGVINIVGSRPSGPAIELKPQYGNHGSPKFDLFGTDVWGRLGMTVNGSAYNTDGFPIVIANERGPIDINATEKYHNLDVKLDYSATDRLKAFFRVGNFGENRGNGKIDEVNDTQWTSLSGGIRSELKDGSDVQATLYGDIEHFHSTFEAVPATNPPRSIDRLSIDQHVPTHAYGSVVQWSKALSASNYLSAGTDFHWVSGDSQEDSYNPAPGPIVPPVQQAVLALYRVSGGTQRNVGAFLQDVIAALPQLSVTLSLRADHWRNYDAHNLETLVPSGAPSASNNPMLPDRDDTAVSPRAAAVYHLSDRMNVWGDIGGGFRAPTLNELYRQFRVGNVLTLPNANLGPERLVGGEAGVNIIAARDLSVRGTWFDNRVSNPVSNITLSTVGSNVTQQRQNLGQTQIWGVQTEVEYRVASEWRISGGYIYDHATVTEFAANPALVGNAVPQVPRHRGSLQLSYVNPRYASVAFGVQFIGRQFDDDLNTRTVPGESAPGLPGYATVDLMLTRTLARNFEAFFGVENLFDQQYIVGTLPTTIGSPRLVNGGIRVRFSGQ